MEQDNDRIGIVALRLLNSTLDFLVFLAAFSLGCATRWRVDLYNSPLLEKFGGLANLGILFLVFFLFNYVALRGVGAYPTQRVRSFDDMAAAYFRAVAAALVAIIFVSYISLAYPVRTSRLLLFSASGYAFILLLAKEWVLRRLLGWMWKKGYSIRNAVLVGGDPLQLAGFHKEITENHWVGMRVLGAVVPGAGTDPWRGETPRLGTLARLSDLFRESVVDCVIFLDYDHGSPEFATAIQECQQRGVETWLHLDILRRISGGVYVESLLGTPFLGLRRGPQKPMSLMVKYALDRVLSAILLVLLAPVFVLVALVIRLSSPGPIIFKQKRVGLHGRTFTFYKFRSMVDHAEELKESLKPLNQMLGPVFKIEDDPRITPLGKFLRKTSLDELPQLWNVFLGDMSLVGPRPLPKEEAEEFTSWQWRRLSMKPGITCIWQVTGRSEVVDFNDWVKMDLYYIDRWSLWLDFKLLLQTIPAVLTARGAR